MEAGGRKRCARSDCPGRSDVAEESGAPSATLRQSRFWWAPWVAMAGKPLPRPSSSLGSMYRMNVHRGRTLAPCSGARAPARLRNIASAPRSTCPRASVRTPRRRGVLSLSQILQKEVGERHVAREHDRADHDRYARESGGCAGCRLLAVDSAGGDRRSDSLAGERGRRHGARGARAGLAAFAQERVRERIHVLVPAGAVVRADPDERHISV